MIDYLYGEEERLLPWALEHTIQGHRFRDDAKAIGVAVDGVVRAVSVFDTFGTNDCLFSIFSDGSRRWFKREFAIRTMAFPFVQCHFARITCLVSRLNRESLKFTNKFGGWKLEGVMREAGPFGEDLLLYGMLARECPSRWLTLPPAPLAV